MTTSSNTSSASSRPQDPQAWPAVLAAIAERAAAIDTNATWPAENLAQLAALGALGWSVPTDAGGAALDPVELHRRYAACAAACLTTALVWTQRDSAVGFLLGADPTPFTHDLLSRLAQGAIFATIGIAQLTTSRQHLPPQVVARRVPHGWRIDGKIPWVTGAPHADYIVCGAAILEAPEDRHQILVALERLSPGVAVGPPLPLPALAGSATTFVALDDVFVPDEHTLRGPSPSALAGRAAVRGFALPTCVLPLGVAGGALRQAEELLPGRTPACQAQIQNLRRQHAALAAQIYDVGSNPAAYPMGELSPQLRAAANLMCTRATLAALELAKGHGFLPASPAQRRAREALFFYVWSSPTAVIEKTLSLLAASPERAGDDSARLDSVVSP